MFCFVLLFFCNPQNPHGVALGHQADAICGCHGNRSGMSVKAGVTSSRWDAGALGPIIPQGYEEIVNFHFS